MWLFSSALMMRVLVLSTALLCMAGVVGNLADCLLHNQYSPVRNAV